MSKKILSIMLILVCFFMCTNVKAANGSNFIDLQSYNNIYKLSEDSEVSLPFIKAFTERATFDKKIDSSGISIGQKTIDIEERLAGVQTIVSADTVNIKGTMEYGVIIASNVVISGNIEKDVLIVSQSVFVTDTANIAGDLIVLSETSELKGIVKGNFIASCANLLMEGTVKKDFRVCSETLDFNEANVDGNIYVETNSETDILVKYPNAVVKKIETNVLTETEKRDQAVSQVIDIVTAVILFALFNLLIRKIRPEVFLKLTDKIKQHSSYTVIAGVLGITTIPLIVFILLVLSSLGFGVVTIPVLVVYMTLLVVMISLAKFITGSVIYEAVKDKLKIDNKFKELGLLLAIYAVIYLLCAIPYIAWFMTMTTILFSVGIVVTGLTRKQK